MPHAAELQRFIGDGELRQLYALDRGSGRVIYIEDGQADELRAACHAGSLICPIAGCPSPKFTTSGGTRKRHHFRHWTASAAGHARESYFHQLGKRLLGQWLADRYPEATVTVDEEALDNGQRPDVLVRFPDGRDYALELQYSQLTIADWEQRHSGYREQRVRDIWIFGHLPPQLRHSKYSHEASAPAPVVFTPLAQRMHEDGLPVRFFSPDERQIGTALVERYHDALHFDAVALSFDSLGECELREEGLWTPTDALEVAAREHRIALERDAERRIAETRRVQEREAAAEAQRLNNERLWRQRLRTKQAATERLAQWEAIRPSVMAQLGVDELPPVITTELRADWGTIWHPALWHARLFARYIEGRVGEEFTYLAAVRRFLKRQQYGREQAKIALRAYLFELRRQGYVLFDADGRFIEDPILVVADLKHPPDGALARQLLRARFVNADGSFALATEAGAVLRKLRPVRPGDSVESLEQLQRIDHERHARKAAFEAANNSATQLGAAEMRVELAAGGDVRISTYTDVWEQRQREIRQVLDPRRGKGRVIVTVFTRGGYAAREITLGVPVAATPELRDELLALVA